MTKESFEGSWHFLYNQHQPRAEEFECRGIWCWRPYRPTKQHLKLHIITQYAVECDANNHTSVCTVQLHLKQQIIALALDVVALEDAYHTSVWSFRFLWHCRPYLCVHLQMKQQQQIIPFYAVAFDAADLTTVCSCIWCCRPYICTQLHLMLQTIPLYAVAFDAADHTSVRRRILCCRPYHCAQWHLMLQSADHTSLRSGIWCMGYPLGNHRSCQRRGPTASRWVALK